MGEIEEEQLGEIEELREEKKKQVLLEKEKIIKILETEGEKSWRNGCLGAMPPEQLRRLIERLREGQLLLKIDSVFPTILLKLREKIMVEEGKEVYNVGDFLILWCGRGCPVWEHDREYAIISFIWDIDWSTEYLFLI